MERIGATQLLDRPLRQLVHKNQLLNQPRSLELLRSARKSTIPTPKEGTRNSYCRQEPLQGRRKAALTWRHTCSTVLGDPVSHLDTNVGQQSDTATEFKIRQERFSPPHHPRVRQESRSTTRPLNWRERSHQACPACQSDAERPGAPKIVALFGTNCFSRAPEIAVGPPRHFGDGVPW